MCRHQTAPCPPRLLFNRHVVSPDPNTQAAIEPLRALRASCSSQPLSVRRRRESYSSRILMMRMKLLATGLVSPWFAFATLQAQATVNVRAENTLGFVRRDETIGVPVAELRAKL